MWLHETRRLAAVCDPDQPDAWRSPNVMNVLRQFATKLDSEWRVVATDGKRSWLVTSHGIVTETGETIPFARGTVNLAR
jgi:hypothetical protein